MSTQPTVTIEFIVQVGIIFMAIWGFVKVVGEVIDAVNKRHDREQKWDDYAKNLDNEREKIYSRYDDRLVEIESKIDKNYQDNESKNQEIKAEITILTKSMSAILDGLIQQGCNGAVTEAKKNLDEFLMSKL